MLLQEVSVGGKTKQNVVIWQKTFCYEMRWNVANWTSIVLVISTDAQIIVMK
jgi:hypothetical protein